MSRDWHEWYAEYDDPDSNLSRRLRVVVGAIRAALDRAPEGRVRVLSLCAGDGRDVVLAALDHPRRGDLHGLLVEKDDRLAATAQARALDAGLDLAVVCGDAGSTASVADAVPVDLLLLCGIFGNISDRDIRTTVAAVPSLCATGATVVWTRHRREPDLTPSIRTWFDEAGCEAVDFVSGGPGRFGVGVERFIGTTTPLAVPATLFEFRDDLRG